jgi:hypothetical protein
LGALACARVLLYPTVTVATLHDFHPVTVALPLLAAWLDAIDEGSWRRALGFGALALACREDIALQLALPVLALWWRHPQWRARLVTVAGLLLLYFGVYIVAIQPHFLPKLGSYGLHFASTGTERVIGSRAAVFAAAASAAVCGLVADLGPAALCDRAAVAARLAAAAGWSLGGRSAADLGDQLSVVVSARAQH